MSINKTEEFDDMYHLIVGWNLVPIGNTGGVLPDKKFMVTFMPYKGVIVSSYMELEWAGCEDRNMQPILVKDIDAAKINIPEEVAKRMLHLQKVLYTKLARASA